MNVFRAHLAWLVFSASFCMGQEFSLDQALEAAFKVSPLVSEIDSTLAQSEREAREIALLPNPELDLEQQFYRGGAGDATDNQPSVNIIQPFRLSHLGLRSKVANLREAAARNGKEAELLGFIQQIRLNYAHIWILSERKRLLKDISIKSQKICRLIDQGQGTAVFGKGEQAVFRAEAAKIEAEIQGLQGEIARADSSFIALTGVAAANRTLLKPIIAEIPKDLVSRFANGSLKVQQQLDLLVKVADESLGLAHRDAFPELRPRLVYAHTNDGGEFYGVGISLPLPLWNRNQNAISAANAQKRAADKNKDFHSSDAFQSQLLSSQSAISSSLKELEIYEKKVLPEFQNAFIAYEQQLRAGQGVTFQLWQTLASLNESGKVFAQLWVKAFGERAALGILIQEDI